MYADAARRKGWCIFFIEPPTPHLPPSTSPPTPLYPHLEWVNYLAVIERTQWFTTASRLDSTAEFWTFCPFKQKTHIHTHTHTDLPSVRQFTGWKLCRRRRPRRCFKVFHVSDEFDRSFFISFFFFLSKCFVSSLWQHGRCLTLWVSDHGQPSQLCCLMDHQHHQRRHVGRSGRKTDWLSENSGDDSQSRDWRMTRFFLSGVSLKLFFFFFFSFSLMQQSVIPVHLCSFCFVVNFVFGTLQKRFKKYLVHRGNK